MNENYSDSRSYPKNADRRVKAKALQRENAVTEKLPVLFVTLSVVVVSVVVVVRLLWGSVVG